MGASNGVAHFQRMTNTLLAVIKESCVLYLDDVLLLASTDEEEEERCLEAAHRLFEICKTSGLQASAENSHVFVPRESQFLRVHLECQHCTVWR